LQREQAKQGAVAVSLAWNDPSDLDLHAIVHLAAGGRVEINYRSKRNAGGFLDVDMHVHDHQVVAEPVEIIYWAKPPAGVYSIVAKLFKKRGSLASVPFKAMLKREHDETLSVEGEVGGPKSSVECFRFEVASDGSVTMGAVGAALPAPTAPAAMRAASKAVAKAKAKAVAKGRAAKAKAQARAAEAKAKAKAKAKAEKDSRPRRAAVVVDPYSSGKYLLMDLKRRRVPIIAVRSSTKLSQQFLRSHEANKKFFAAFVDYETIGEDIDKLVEAIKAKPFVVGGVFAGSEPGVELAERLGVALGMPTANGLDKLEARKDKAEMQEALRANGVPAAAQFKSGDIDRLLDWANKRNEWPLVAKPIGGAGSDGIFFCNTAEDLKAAHSGIIGVRNPTGVMNNELALQEFLAGDEYIVDTVSHNGKHLVVAMWVYTKVKGVPWAPQAIVVYQSELIPAHGEIQDKLVDYVFKTLDAVGLKHGPCHTEIMMTKRGPILVEVNARLHGLQGPRLIELCTGISKATYAADVILFSGDLFYKLYQEQRAGRYLYPLNKQCVLLMLVSPVEGYLKASLMDAIKAMELPSILEIIPSVDVGGFLQKSRDLPTLAGTLLMVHESMDQIKADSAKIREAENSGSLYVVSPEPIPNSPAPKSVSAMSPGNVLAGRIRLDSLEKIEDLMG